MQEIFMYYYILDIRSKLDILSINLLSLLKIHNIELMICISIRIMSNNQFGKKIKANVLKLVHQKVIYSCNPESMLKHLLYKMIIITPQKMLSTENLILDGHLALDNKLLYFKFLSHNKRQSLKQKWISEPFIKTIKYRVMYQITDIMLLIFGN